MNEEVYNHDEREGNITDDEGWKGSGERNNSIKNRSEGSVHSKMNVHSEKEMKLYKVKREGKKKNL